MTLRRLHGWRYQMRIGCCRVAVWFVAVAALSAGAIAGARSQERPSLVELLAEFQNTQVFWQQFEVAKQIVKLGDALALPTLEPWLSHEDRHLRGNAAFIFAGLGDARGFQVICAMLTDRSYRPEGQGVPGGSFNMAAPAWWLRSQILADRYYAVHLLGELKDARAVDVLVPLMNDPDVSYRDKVVWALGEIGDRRAISPLIEALRDGDARVRISAIHGLDNLAAKEALPHLRALLNDHAMPSGRDKVSVADTAKAAIAKLEGEPQQ